MNGLHQIKSRLVNFLIDTGDIAYFTKRFFTEVVKRPFEMKEFLRQCYQMGTRKS